MQCYNPNLCKGKTRVVKVNNTRYAHVTQRWLICKKCGFRFATMEVPTMEVNNIFTELISAIKHTSTHFFGRFWQSRKDTP
jgi:transcriptional regulator NrdR family protein